MSMTRKQLNDWALIVDSSARDSAIADTLRQVMDQHGKQHPKYAAAFYCVCQSINPDSLAHYSETEWYQAIITGEAWRLKSPLRSAA